MAVDLHMLLSRYNEEEVILRGEMQNYIVFYRRLIDDLQNDVKKMTSVETHLASITGCEDPDNEVHTLLHT